VIEAAPGDVLAVWTGRSLTQNLIRVGEALRGLPAVANHVIVVTHQDRLGRWMGIEGRPGGVGPVDCTRVLGSHLTRSNNQQPRDSGNGQTQAFLTSCAKSLGIAYDWVAIAEDALDALHADDLAKAIDPLWRWPSKTGQLPGHVVCSSLAAMLYEHVGWAHPEHGSERACEPADWWQWSDQHQWVIQ